MNRWSPYVLSVLRIIAAFVYWVHGAQKLFGFPAPFPVPHLPSLFLAGGMIETFGRNQITGGQQRALSCRLCEPAVPPLKSKKSKNLRDPQESERLKESEPLPQDRNKRRR
jgi:hypothetical protein